MLSQRQFYHSFNEFFKYVVLSDGGSKENCGVLNIEWNGWNDWTCIIPKASPIQCVCEKVGKVYFKLRGKCPESSIDTYWIPQVEDGQFFLHGLQTSDIVFDNKKWILKSLGKNGDTLAMSDATFHSFAMGKSNWLISNDEGRVFSHNSKLRYNSVSLLV